LAFPFSSGLAKISGLASARLLWAAKGLRLREATLGF
jgi:hypothetical protein